LKNLQEEKYTFEREMAVKKGKIFWLGWVGFFSESEETRE
jgi:hypothetical protein